MYHRETYCVYCTTMSCKFNPGTGTNIAWSIDVKYIQWNPSNPDTIGPEESVLISEVSLISGVEKYTHMVLGEEESVLFKEVSLFQGCPYSTVYLLPPSFFPLPFVLSPLLLPSLYSLKIRLCSVTTPLPRPAVPSCKDIACFHSSILCSTLPMSMDQLLQDHSSSSNCWGTPLI